MINPDRISRVTDGVFVSGEVAAGRAVRRLVSPGDRISAGDVEGEVLDIQSVAVEVATDEGTILLPHSHLLGHSFTIQRADASGEPAAD